MEKEKKKIKILPLMPQVQKLHTIFVFKKIYENIQEQIYVNENMKKEYSMYRSQHPH